MDYRYISFFDKGSLSKDQLGNKGHGLHKMSRLGLPVPEGFTITLDGYHLWKDKGCIHGELQEEMLAALIELEERTEKYLDDTHEPLFVSVRSGAPISMPGMMETILNIGANEKTINALSKYGERFANDVFRSFLDRYGRVVAGMTDLESYLSREFPALISWADTYIASPGKIYDQTDKILNCLKKKSAPEAIAGCIQGTIPLTSAALRHIKPEKLTGAIVECDGIQGVIQQISPEAVTVSWNNELTERLDVETHGKMISLVPQLQKLALEFAQNVYAKDDDIAQTKLLRERISSKLIPDDPLLQITGAVDAVFASWESQAAKEYRKIQQIPDYLGTAVTIQRMVFGNKNSQSGTAVIFSSHPRDATAQITGEYSLCMQGEGIVSGTAVPQPLEKMDQTLYTKISTIARDMEVRAGAVQDMEFTWEDGKVYVLQTRNAHLNPLGKVRFLLREYMQDNITGKDVYKQLSKEQLQALLSLEEVAADSQQAITKGKSLVLGAVSGVLVRDASEMEKYGGMEYILYKESLETTDIADIHKAKGIITKTTNSFTHAAVIARSLGKVFVTGCDMEIKWRDCFMLGGKKFTSGDIVTLDGNTGDIYAGRLDTLRGTDLPEVGMLAQIAQKILPPKPFLYEAQCLEDLVHLQDDNAHVLYSIDFDCAKYSGALEGNRTTKELLQVRALDVYERLKDRLLLCSYGHFDAFMHDSLGTKKTFVNMFPSHVPYVMNQDITKYNVLKPWSEDMSLIRLAHEVFYES